MGRAAVLVAACLLVLPSFAGAQGGETVEAAIAARLQLGSDGLEPDLARLGAPAIAPLFEVLVQGAVPSSWSSAGSGLALSGDAREAVLGALAAMPVGPLRAHLASVAVKPERDPLRARAALGILGRAGAAQDVGLCVQLVTPFDFEAAVPREQRLAVEQALLAIAARDSETIGALRGIFNELHPSLLAPVVSCIAAGDPRESIETLASLLDRVAGIDALLLAEIAKVGERLPRPIEGRIFEPVRRALGSQDANEVILAAGALGGLDDFGSIPRLIDLLSADDERIRAAADDALQRMTGRVFRGSARAWDAWYAEESEWWRGADQVLGRIDHPDPAVALAALHEISGHRIHRHELALAVSRALDRPQRELVLLACSILRSLDSRAAVPALVRALEHRNAQAAEAALKTLRALTGQDYPAEDPAWRDLADREVPSSRG